MGPRRTGPDGKSADSFMRAPLSEPVGFARELRQVFVWVDGDPASNRRETDGVTTPLNRVFSSLPAVAEWDFLAE